MTQNKYGSFYAIALLNNITTIQEKQIGLKSMHLVYWTTNIA